MSERYNPRKLKRDWIAELGNGAKPRDAKQDAIAAQATYDRHQTLAKLRGEIAVVALCRHDQPWLDCTLCSKPRSKP
jgi:hypothetical protein